MAPVSAPSKPKGAAAQEKATEAAATAAGEQAANQDDLTQADASTATTESTLAGSEFDSLNFSYDTATIGTDLSDLPLTAGTGFSAAAERATAAQQALAEIEMPESLLTTGEMTTRKQVKADIEAFETLDGITDQLNAASRMLSQQMVVSKTLVETNQTADFSETVAELEAKAAAVSSKRGPLNSIRDRIPAETADKIESALKETAAASAELAAQLDKSAEDAKALRSTVNEVGWVDGAYVYETAAETQPAGSITTTAQGYPNPQLEQAPESQDAIETLPPEAIEQALVESNPEAVTEAEQPTEQETAPAEEQTEEVAAAETPQAEEVVAEQPAPGAEVDPEDPTYQVNNQPTAETQVEEQQAATEQQQTPLEKLATQIEKFENEVTSAKERLEAFKNLGFFGRAKLQISAFFSSDFSLWNPAGKALQSRLNVAEKALDRLIPQTEREIQDSMQGFEFSASANLPRRLLDSAVPVQRDGSIPRMNSYHKMADKFEALGNANDDIQVARRQHSLSIQTEKGTMTFTRSNDSRVSIQLADRYGDPVPLYNAGGQDIFSGRLYNHDAERAVSFFLNEGVEFTARFRNRVELGTEAGAKLRVVDPESYLSRTDDERAAIEQARAEAIAREQRAAERAQQAADAAFADEQAREETVLT